MHYIEHGSGAPVLFLHGNPTSSYLWRNVLPAVASRTGRRGIAPDLIGFGRSDKLRDGNYSLEFHAETIERFIEQLGLNDIVLVLHDWGGPLGMRYAVRHPDTVQAVALMETFLWDMCWKDLGKFAPVFRLMRSPAGYALLQLLNLFVDRILPGSVLHREHMTLEVMQQYRSPFRTVRSRRAIRVFPKLIPIEGRPESSSRFMDEIDAGLPRLHCPVLWIKAAPGAIITAETEYRLTALSALLPGLSVEEFGKGLHYLQEDDPLRLADMLAIWINKQHLRSTPVDTGRILPDAA